MGPLVTENRGDSDFSFMHYTDMTEMTFEASYDKSSLRNNAHVIYCIFHGSKKIIFR